MNSFALLGCRVRQNSSPGSDLGARRNVTRGDGKDPETQPCHKTLLFLVARATALISTIAVLHDSGEESPPLKAYFDL